MQKAAAIHEAFPITQIRELPTLPDIYSRLVALTDTDSANISVSDIEQIIRQDPALTATLLRIVSSPLYAAHRTVVTVAQAVRLLGFDALRHLVLAVSVISLFQREQDSLLPPLGYWQHCLGTAVAARQIALQLGAEQPEEFFVAGLLHDLGKLVHSQYFSENFEKALALAATERLPLVDAEEQLFGFSHADTGGFLLAQWGLAPVLQRAVLMHHAPLPPTQEPFSRHEYVVHCADCISLGLGLGCSGSHAFPNFLPLSWEILHLSRGHLAKIVQATRAEFVALQTILLDPKPSAEHR